MRVIALSALVLPLGFIAQVADQHHPRSSGEYAKDPWGRRLPDAVGGSGERSRGSERRRTADHPGVAAEQRLARLRLEAGLPLSAEFSVGTSNSRAKTRLGGSPAVGMRGGASGAARLDYVQGASEVSTRGGSSGSLSG
jgi:hypothetical protein